MSRDPAAARMGRVVPAEATGITSVVVTGMHRSGTSLVASYLAALGVDMGGELLPADERNRHGYFEDARFVDFHKRLLTAATPEEEHGHRDWGWTESEVLDLERARAYSKRARALLEDCDGRTVPWGWKDPRTALLLDFWDELLEDPRYVLLYRFPWDVADSMQRLGATVFLEHPEYAYRIWSYYNRRLLDFYRRHRERAVLLSTNALVEQPERFLTLLGEKLGLDLEAVAFDACYDSAGLHTIGGADPLIGLVAATSPECTGLLSELDDEADLGGRALWQLPPFPGSGAAAPATVALSVVIPCRDHGEFLIEAVASVERCLSIPYELIVVNDGSEQTRTLEVLETLRRAGYHVIDQPASGLSPARNRGFEESRGRYVLPLDADNRLAPGFVEAAIEALDADSGVGVVHGDWQEFGRRRRRRRAPDFALAQLLPRNRIDACAVVRRQVWAELEGYDGAMTPLEDWDFWLRAGRCGWRFHRLEQVTFEYRVRPNSLIHIADDDEVRGPIVDRVVERQRDLYEPYFRRRLSPILARWLWWTLGVRSRLDRELLETTGELQKSKTRARALDRRLKGRTAKVDELQMSVDRLELTIARIRQRLSEREQELGESRETQARTDQRLEGVTRDLGRREQELEELTAALGRREQEREELTGALRRREQELEQLTATLGRRELELEQLTATLRRRELELEQLTATLGRRELELEQLTAALGRREQELGKATHTLARREQKIDELEELLARRRKKLHQLDDRLNARAAAVEALSGQLEKRQQLIGRLEASLASQEQALDGLRSQLADGERSRLRLEHVVRLRDSRLEVLDHELDWLRRVLALIHSSIAFRLVRSYWRISKRLWPPGSRRRRLLDRVLRRSGT